VRCSGPVASLGWPDRHGPGVEPVAVKAGALSLPATRLDDVLATDGQAAPAFDVSGDVRLEPVHRAAKGHLVHELPARSRLECVDDGRGIERPDAA